MKNADEGSTIASSKRVLESEIAVGRRDEVREKVRLNKSEGTKRKGRIGFADEDAKRKAPLYESIFLSRHADNTCPATLEKCTCLLRDGRQQRLQND